MQENNLKPNSIRLITADAPDADHYSFKQWTGDTDHITSGTATSNPATITIPDHSVVLNATYNPYRVLTVDEGMIISEAFTEIKYGRLYNWYATAGTGNNSISRSDDWVLLSGFSTVGSGGDLKETGIVYWDSPNTGATNTSEFGFRGTGYRSNSNGSFLSINQLCFIRSQPGQYQNYLSYNNSNINAGNGIYEKGGIAQRLMKINSLLNVGEYGVYIGNDGKKYRTKCVLNGTIKYEVMMSNLAETKFRDGSLIPIVTDNAAWANLTTPGCCSYNNDDNNI